jgi:hypothetical protein
MSCERPFGVEGDNADAASIFHHCDGESYHTGTTAFTRFVTLPTHSYNATNGRQLR